MTAGGVLAATLLGEQLLVVGEDDALRALATDTGAERWQAPIEPPQGLRAVVAAAGDSSYAVAPDGAVTAFEAMSGAERWREPAGQALRLAAMADGVYVTTARGEGTWGSLLALDAETGAERWQMIGSGELGELTVTEQTVYVVDRGDLVAVDAATGQERWHAPGLPPVDGLAGAAETVVAVATSDLVAFDAETGEERWRLGLEATDGWAWQPTIVGQTLYAGTYQTRQGGDRGFVYAVDLATGDERWRIQLPAEVAKGPVVGGGAVAVGLFGGGLAELDAEGGTVRWTLLPSLSFPSALAADDDSVYVGAADGTVVAYDHGPAEGAVAGRTMANLTPGITLAAGMSVEAGDSDGEPGPGVTDEPAVL